ncbi:MAG: hypothetical protein RLP44_24910 [Aggregatilineales bacterium]
MQNLKHIRFITENYGDMQGLRQIPLSICMAMVGVLSIASSMDLISGWGVVIGMLILIGLGYASYDWVGKRYNALYGSVQSRQSGIADPVWITAAIVVFLIEMFADLPFSPSMLIIATFFVYRWYISDGLLPHYLPLAIVLLLMVALPQVVESSERVSWFLIVLGIVHSIAGVFDHRALTRVLQRPAPDSIHEEEYA